MMNLYYTMSGRPGPSGFGSSSTAEQVTEGIDAGGLTVIITGGASGIGLETARVLAMRRAHVIIGARNMQTANEAKRIIMEEIAYARVDVLQLDLASIASVNSFFHNFNALNLPLHILINNAGVMFCPHELTEDGVEKQFATNHLGHFILTNLLLDKMKATAKNSGIQGRIVNLSSIAHHYSYTEGIRFKTLNDPFSYNDKIAYAQSKLANLLHVKELSRRLKKEGANVTANAVHPGMIYTNLMRHSWFLTGLFKLVTFVLWKNVPQGAATTCYVALHPNLEGVSGRYFVDCNEKEPNRQSNDEVLAKTLWDFSVKLASKVPE